MAKAKSPNALMAKWETPVLAWKAPKPKLKHPADGLVLFDVASQGNHYTFDMVVTGDCSAEHFHPLPKNAVVNCLHVDPINKVCKVLASRVLNSDVSEQSILKHVQELLADAATSNSTKISAIVMRDWYAVRDVFALIEKIGKTYWSLVSNSRRAQIVGALDAGRFHAVKSLAFDDVELVHGKLVKVSAIDPGHPLRLFRLHSTIEENFHVATNQLENDSWEMANLIGEILNARRIEAMRSFQ